MQNTVRENLLQIQEEIAPCKPKIIAVTKYFDKSAIIDAYNAGLRDFAESRVIEASEKIKNLPQEVRENSTFHFIGHLQTNKVKKAIEVFDFIQSVDSLRLAEKISEESEKAGKNQKVLVQINIAEEEQKFGFSKGEIFEIFPKILELKNIEVVGLMNMTPFGAEDSELDGIFKTAVEIKNRLEEKFNCRIQEMSMGMSQDYKIAARNGATMLRIGRRLFR